MPVIPEELGKGVHIHVLPVTFRCDHGIGENNFQEVRCANVFEAMRQCCLKHKPISLVCEGYRLEPREFAPVTDRPTKND